MANITYYISASYIGTALEDSNFLLYHTECDNNDYLISTISSSSLSTGISFVVSDSIEKVYLVPLSSECPLGCGYNYSITLDQFVALSPTPTVTPSSTPASTLTPTPTRTVTPTPTSSVFIDYRTFGLHTVSKNGSSQVRFVWSVSDYGSQYQRIIFAQQLASWLCSPNNINLTTNISSPNYQTITKDFKIYNNAKTTLMTTVVRSGSPTVYFFDDGTQSVVVADGVSSGLISSKDTFQYTEYTL